MKCNLNPEQDSSNQWWKDRAAWVMSGGVNQCRMFQGPKACISLLLRHGEITTNLAAENNKQCLWVQSLAMVRLGPQLKVSQAGAEAGSTVWSHLEAGLGKNPFPCSPRLWASLTSYGGLAEVLTSCWLLAETSLLLHALSALTMLPSSQALSQHGSFLLQSQEGKFSLGY